MNILTGSLLATFMFIPFAQAQTQTSEASQVTLDQVMTEVNDPNGKISPYVAEVSKKFNSMVAEITGEKEATPEQKQSRLAKEFSKLKVRYTFNEFDRLIDTKFIDAGVYYQYVVEPAFRNDEQLRKDIWVIQANATNAQKFSLGAGGEIKLTFSRFFSGPGAKLNAMRALPYLPTQTPLNVNEVKTKLKNGDGFRFEITGSLSATGSDSLSNSSNAGVSLGVRRSALFIMDLFKVNEKVARTRFFGLKNHGEVIAGISVKTDSPLNLISNKLNDLLTLGFGVSFTKPIAYKNKLPIDSMMLDYLYQFSTEGVMDLNEVRNRTDIAESALEQIIGNIRKGGFAVLFGGLGTDTEAAKELLSKAEIAEKLNAEDAPNYNSGNIPFNKVRVYNYFKGRMQANSMSFNLSGRLSDLVKGNQQNSSLTSFITSFDTDLKKSHYILDNSSIQAGTGSLFGLNKYSYLFDYDVLIEASESGQPIKISDIVIRNQFEDTTQKVFEGDVIRKSLIRTLPGNYKNDPAIINFFPTTEQTNIYQSYRYSFSELAFLAIRRLSKPVIAQKLFEFLDDHPNRARMHLEVDTQNGGSGLGTYAEQKAHEIYAIVDENNSEQQRLDALRIAQRDPIFEMYLVGEFLASLLPTEDTDQYFNLDAKITSAETGTKTLKIGQNKVSNIYDAVSFLRSVINDRSLDLQMTNSTDKTGSTVYVPHRLKDQMKISAPVQ